MSLSGCLWRRREQNRGATRWLACSPGPWCAWRCSWCWRQSGAQAAGVPCTPAGPPPCPALRSCCARGAVRGVFWPRRWRTRGHLGGGPLKRGQRALRGSFNQQGEVRRGQGAQVRLIPGAEGEQRRGVTVGREGHQGPRARQAIGRVKLFYRDAHPGLGRAPMRKQLKQ